jgi:hypothetical protein
MSRGGIGKKKSIKKMIQNKNNRNLKECGPNLKTN